MDVLVDLYAWLSGLPPLVVYTVLFLFAYAENVFPPVPGDIALVVGGMLAGIGVVHLPLLIVVCVAAGSLGFLTAFSAGRAIGPALLDPHRYRWVPKDLLRRAEASVLRHGRGIVLANRFVPGVRSAIALAVGMSAMPVHITAVLATLSAAGWSLLLCSLGYALGDNHAALARALGYVKEGTVLLLAVLVLVGLGFYVRGRRRQRFATHAHDLPPPPVRLAAVRLRDAEPAA